MSNKPNRGRRRRGKVKINKVVAGGLAGGAAMAMGTQAYADPMGVRWDTPIVYTAGEQDVIDIDLDGDDDLWVGYGSVADAWTDEYWDITVRGWLAWTDGLYGTEVCVLPGGYGDETRRFNEGDLIGPGGVSAPTAAETCLGYYYFYSAYNWLIGYTSYAVKLEEGQFEDNRGFLGFKFDFYGSEHWGWLEVNINHEQYNEMNGALEIWGYGLETEPGTGIPAGAVPEPGTLAALAFGAAALGSRRRKPGR